MASTCDVSTQDREAACGVDEPGRFEVRDEGREIVVWAELSGFTESELDVQLHENTLTIKAGKFSREVSLPAAALPGKVQATYINGVLELRVPKA